MTAWRRKPSPLPAGAEVTLVTQHGSEGRSLIRPGTADHESVATPLPERAHTSAWEDAIEVLCHLRRADGRYLLPRS